MTPRPILFRCPASRAVGFGHVVRCLALADALAREGVQSAFAMQAADAQACAWLAERGLPLHVVPESPDSALSRADAERLGQIAHLIDADAVIVDHYGAGDDYFARLRREVPMVGAIDDLADRELDAVDWVVNHNATADDYPYASVGGVVLRGLRYALLREQFAAARTRAAGAVQGVASRVLIAFGAGDSDAVTAQTVQALGAVDRSLQIRAVVAGTTRQTQAAAAASPHQVEPLASTPAIEQHMVWSDVCVAAGGVTCWELCCLGVPMVVSALAPNQQPNVRAVERAGCGVVIGDWDEGAAARLAVALAALLRDPERRRAMATRGMQLVDGEGATRAARSLIETRAALATHV